jgi:hypothetical protein
MEIQPCIRCGRGLKAPQGINQTGDKALAVYITIVTVGIRPRQRSRLRRSVLCPPCAVSMAFAPAPDGAFNQTVYDALNELNEQSIAMLEAAREVKINPRSALRLMPGSQPDKTMAIPVLLPSA